MNPDISPEPVVRAPAREQAAAPSFDLGAFVADDMPGMLETEAGDDWRRGYEQGRPVSQPVTSLLADDSPLTSFLKGPDEPPEGAGRNERRAFYDERDAAQAAAVEAVQDAAEDHARWLDLQRRRASANALDAMLARAAKAKQAKENGLPPTARPGRADDNTTTGPLGRW